MIDHTSLADRLNRQDWLPMTPLRGLEMVWTGSRHRSTRPIAAALLEQETASAMVEMSIILPTIFLMLIGCVDFALVLGQAMTVQDSARAGAQYALLYATANDTAGMQSAAIAAAANIPNYAATATNFCACSAGGAAVSCSNSLCGAYGSPAVYVQVTATATLPVLYGIQGFPATIPVRSVARMRTTWTGTH